MDEEKIIETRDVTVSRNEETNSKIVNNFKFKETIGKGIYSKVKKCIDLTTNKEYAVKIFNYRLLKKKKKSVGTSLNGTLEAHYMIEDALNEIKIYKELPILKNENILKLHQILIDEKNEKTYLIFELADYGPITTIDENTGEFTLNSHLNNNEYNESLIKSFMLDIAKGIYFLHSNNIVHRDIKSDNIVLFSNNHCKLSDLGLALKLNDENEKFSMTEGNIYFYPPEFIVNEDELFSYKPVDIWAFGVTIYTIIFKKLPFLPEIVSDIMGLFQMISEAKVNYNVNGIQISEEMKILLGHIFEKDPTKRFTAKDIVEYPWLNQE